MNIEPTQMKRLMTALNAVPLPQPTFTGSQWPSGPCIYLGDQVGTTPCKTCTGTVSLKVFNCNLGHGKCSPAQNSGVRHCSNCHDRRTSWPMQYDERNLWPKLKGLRFNTTIAPYEDGYVLATRSGWRGSEIYIGKLDKKFHPIGEPKQLNLWDEAAVYGREDPRFFWHNGQLHLTYIGVMGTPGPRHTNVLIARLSPTLEVEEITHPHIVNRGLWEKNHSYFSQENKLYCVYTVSPHQVHELIDGKLEPKYVTPQNWNWNGGERRGGASPIQVGDEFWHFFHDRVRTPHGIIYRTGLYTFEAKPPFKPKRYIPEPLLTANPSTKPADQWCSCVFVCGAVPDGDSWVLSHGIHDRWTELHRFSHEELSNKLIPIV